LLCFDTRLDFATIADLVADAMLFQFISIWIVHTEAQQMKAFS
jgi:hypothetical protein